MTPVPEKRVVEVIVADSGTGIDPARHSSSGGSGLGLSIAKEIVDLHGGQIRACKPTTIH